jgi:hypothetical protein
MIDDHDEEKLSSHMTLVAQQKEKLVACQASIGLD